MLAGEGVDRLKVALDVRPGLLGRRVEAVEVEELPVPQERRNDLVVVDAEVVDPGSGDQLGLAVEVLDARPGHLEGHDLLGDGPHCGGRVNLQRRADQVSVEDHVEVLVGGHPGEQLLRHGVLGEPPRVAVADPCCQLLEGHVGDGAQWRLAAAVEPLLHLLHAAPLKGNRIDTTGYHQIVTHRDGVASLLRRPTVHPGTPGAVPAEGRRDHMVVAGQVVLCEQADLEGDLGDVGQPGLLRFPRQGVEVTALAPGDVLVRHPFGGQAQVAVEVGRGDGLKLTQEVDVCEGGHAHTLTGQLDSGLRPVGGIEA